MQLKQNIRSEQGASIVMALFLFLVCSAIAAVVLSAATAAAGRVAGLADADQKYYSVTSAAELVRDMMGGEDGVAVNVVCTRQTVTTPAGVSTTGDSVVTIDGAALGSAPGDLSFTQIAAQALVNAGTASGGSVWDWQFGGASTATELSPLAISCSGSLPSGASLDSLNAVTVTPTLNGNGDIVLRFQSGASASADSASYTLVLTCKGECATKTESRVTRNSTNGNLTRTDTKTSTITWKATELKRPKPSEGGGA